MLLVIAALVPGFIAYFWFFGWGIVINSVIAVLTALACEAWMLKLRNRPLLPFITDGSAIITGLLIALAIPPLLPWWMPVIASGFAIIMAKHLYGGLGYNPFNPAMVGYAVLLVSFPREMTAWLEPSMDGTLVLTLTENSNYNFLSNIPSRFISYDTITMATPLDVIHTQMNLGQSVADIKTAYPHLQGIYGIGWDWVNSMYLLGGLFLLYKRVISWHIPVAIIASLGSFALISNIFAPETSAGPLFHILGGATMLGAFFIATDPITASTTPKGMIVYGIGIGIIIYVIRAWGGYPDGVAFAVLIMNMAVPTIDTFTQPRVFGHKKTNPNKSEKINVKNHE